MASMASWTTTLLSVLFAWCLSSGCSPHPTDGVIEEISPAPGSTGVSVHARVSIRSSLPFDPKTISSQNFLLQTAGGARIDGTVVLEDRDTRLAFVPDSPIPDDERFVACLSAEVRTIEGGGLTAYRPDPELDRLEPHSPGECFEFSTASALRVRSAYLVENPTEVRIYFSQEIASGSIESSSVTVDQDGQTLQVGLRYSPTLNRLTIFPPNELRRDEPFAVFLPSDLRSSDGQMLNDGEGSVLEIDGQELSIR
jgi:hypothetical protein